MTVIEEFKNQAIVFFAETVTLVANSVEMTGISVNRIDRILENDIVREEYGLDSEAPKSIYRTVDRLGENSDAIVEFLGTALKRKYGLRMQTVFMDWTSLFFEAPQHGIDWRPARRKKETAIKGRIPISFLALFCKFAHARIHVVEVQTEVLHRLDQRLVTEEFRDCLNGHPGMEEPAAERHSQSVVGEMEAEPIKARKN